MNVPVCTVHRAAIAIIVGFALSFAQSQNGFADFVQAGWQAGAQTTAAAQAQGQGAAFQGPVSIQPGVWLYQLTDEGLALEATAKGTKYYKDDQLN